jgi:hypothetical protein
MVMRRAILVVAAFSALVFAVGSLAGAKPPGDPWEERLHAALDAAKQAATAQSGSPAPLVADNFELLGHANLGGGVPNGDVWFYDHGGSVGKFAYIGTWSGQCTGQGAKIVDVNDPTQPKWEGFVGNRKNSSNEDVVVRRIGTRDVLGIGVQACGPGGSDGLALFDVTNPLSPVELSFLATPTGVHELDLVVRPDGRAFALLATPFSEFIHTYFEALSAPGEFRIVEITNPANPVPLADWGIIEDSDLLIQGGNDPVSSSFQGLPGFFAAHYAHSVRGADNGATAYVSYWDGGIIKLDISNPSAPAYVGRTIYPTGSSGDGHSMTPYQVGTTRYILQNDEDFQSLPDVLVTSSATGTQAVEGIQMPWAPGLLTAGGQTVSGGVHDAGDGCQASDYAGGAGRIALADTVDPFYFGIIPGFPEPPCTIGQQAALASAAGATAFVSNLDSPDDAYVLSPGLDRKGFGALTIPVFQIAEIDDIADAIRATPAADTMTITAVRPSWGYLRIFLESAGSEWQQVATFTDAPHADGEHPTPPGSWSIHNTEVLGNRAYSAWYSNGVVAIDVSNPLDPVRVGQFVPDTSNRHANSLGVGPAEVWGVAIDPATGIIYLSDMRTGLWIVRPTGQAAPSS